jgi:hypothetical protein
MYVRREPEFGLAAGVCHVDVNTRLFPGKEEQSELAVADDGGGHVEHFIRPGSGMATIAA